MHLVRVPGRVGVDDREASAPPAEEARDQVGPVLTAEHVATEEVVGLGEAVVWVLPANRREMLGDAVAAVVGGSVEQQDRCAPRSPRPARRSQVVPARVAGVVVAVVGHQEIAARRVATHGELARARRTLGEKLAGIAFAVLPTHAAVLAWLAEEAPLLDAVDCPRAEAGQPHGAFSIRVAGAEQVDVSVVLNRADVEEARGLNLLVEHKAPRLHRVGAEMAQDRPVVGTHRQRARAADPPVCSCRSRLRRTRRSCRRRGCPPPGPPCRQTSRPRCEAGRRTRRHPRPR